MKTTSNKLIRSLQKDAGVLDAAGGFLKGLLIDPITGMYTNTRDGIGALSRGDIAGAGSNALKLLGNTALTALNVGTVIIPGGGLAARVGAQAVGKLALGAMAKRTAASGIAGAEKASLAAAQKLVAGGAGRTKALDELFASSAQAANAKHLSSSLARRQASLVSGAKPTPKMVKMQQQLSEAQTGGRIANSLPANGMKATRNYSNANYDAVIANKNLGAGTKMLIKAQKGLIGIQDKAVHATHKINTFAGNNLTLNRYFPVSISATPLLPAIGAGVGTAVGSEIMHGYSKPGQFDSLVNSPEFNSYYGKRRIGNLMAREGDSMKATSMDALERTGELDRFNNWKSRVLG